jgi:hypothetical protein
MSPRVTTPAVALALCLALPGRSWAQAEPAPATPPASDTPPSGEAPQEGDIIVTAPSRRGEAIGSGVPDIRIDRDEIATYGSPSIGALLGDLKPQTGEAPVILVNGRRISGMDEISRLPPEAIARIDILPEEVALNYGYRADQRVVNIVLERRFKAVTIEAAEQLPTGGGRSETDLSGSLVRINGKGRLSLDVDYGRDTELAEHEAGIAGEQARYRTLLPSAETLGVGATLNRKVDVLGGINATLNARIDRKSGESLFGLPLDPLISQPLVGRTKSTSAHASLVVNGGVSDWYWSLTSSFDHSRSLSRTDRNGISGGITRDRIEATSTSASGDLVANGPIASLPAGKLSATLRAAIARRGQDTRGHVSGVPQLRDEADTQAQLSANINLPIASRKKHVLSGVGDLSANFNLAHDGVSGVGSADTFGYGLTWSPIEALRLTTTLTRSESLPPQAQREDPIVTTPNVPVYDFVTGETVEVTRIDGGNPALKADSRKILSISARYKPFKSSSLTFNLTYGRSRTRNQIGSLPAVTAAIEAAFPERFTRDSSGKLVAVDARPVNFARARQRQLSWGIFWSHGIGEARGADPGRASAAKPGHGAPGPMGADEEAMLDSAEAASPAAGLRHGSGMGRDRILLSFNHVWRIQNDLLIRDGLPVLDLLDGEAFGTRGQARHQLNARANLMMSGVGATLEAKWQSGSTLKGSTTELVFSDLATVDLRLFVNLGQQRLLVERHPFLKGSRLSLDVGNLFDSRTRVHDSLGNRPPSFAPAYLDPLGRTVKLSFRKLF